MLQARSYKDSLAHTSELPRQHGSIRESGFSWVGGCGIICRPPAVLGVPFCWVSARVLILGVHLCTVLAGLEPNWKPRDGIIGLVSVVCFCLANRLSAMVCLLMESGPAVKQVRYYVFY